MLLCKYMDRNGLAVVLLTKRSASVASEVNLKIPLGTGNKAHKRGDLSGFETQDNHHEKSKAGISVAPQKGQDPFALDVKLNILSLGYSGLQILLTFILLKLRKSLFKSLHFFLQSLFIEKVSDRIHFQNI